MSAAVVFAALALALSAASLVLVLAWSVYLHGLFAEEFRR